MPFSRVAIYIINTFARWERSSNLFGKRFSVFCDCTWIAAAIVGIAVSLAWAQDETLARNPDAPGHPSHAATTFQDSSCDSVGCDVLGASRRSRGLLGCQVEDPGALFSWCRGGTILGLDEPLMSDRPDFTEASSVVGRGVLQIESGYTYGFKSDSAGSIKSHSIGEPLFRYGIFRNWLEMRVGWNYSAEKVGSNTTDGAEDLYLGCKLGLTAQEGILPEMALVPQMKVPTGSRSFTGNKTLPGCNWLYGWDINDSLSTAGSTQFNRAIDGISGKTYTEWAQSWTIGYGLTDKLGAYTEWFGIFPQNADSDQTQNYFNGGFTYSVTNDLQFDVRAGKGLNDASDDYFIGSGLVLRFQ